jgi:hypothetical protein
VIAVVITLLARKDSRRSADAAERSAKAAVDGVAESRRSAAAAEKGLEHSDADTWDDKVKTLADHLKGNNFHAKKTKALVEQLASTADDQRELFIQASARAGYTDNLDVRLGHLGLSGETKGDT